MKNIATIARIFSILVHFCQGIHGEQNVTDTDTTSSGRCWMEGNSTAAFRHNQLCKAALEDERNLVNTFYMTSSASITALISGSLSAVSSLIILFLIRRSEIGLSSIYHRIISGISAADFIASSSFAFNTLPMPKDVIYNFDHRWVRGNQTTCTIQGFLILTFFAIEGLFNSMLAMYYAFAIIYKKRDAEIKRISFFTTIFPIVSICIVVTGSVLGLFCKAYNPTPFDAWTSVVAYPYYCSEENNIDDSCRLRIGDQTIRRIFVAWMYVQLTTLNVWTFLTSAALVAVAISVFTQEKYIKEMNELVYGNTARFDRCGGNTNRMLESTKKRQAHIKALYVQCAAYIVVNLVCHFSYLAHIGDRGNHGWVLQFYHVAFRPLQGFFNLIIFVGHKVHDAKITNRSLTLMEAIAKVFKDKEEKQFLLSNMSLVRAHKSSFYFDGEEEEIEMYDIDNRIKRVGIMGLGKDDDDDDVESENENENKKRDYRDTDVVIGSEGDLKQQHESVLGNEGDLNDARKQQHERVLGDEGDLKNGARKQQHERVLGDEGDLNDARKHQQHDSDLSFDDDIGARSRMTGDSRLSNIDEDHNSAISNYTEMFGSWVSRARTGSQKGSSISASTGVHLNGRGKWEENSNIYSLDVDS